MLYKYLIQYASLLVLLAPIISSGTFKGTVLDNKTSDPLIGANVMVGDIDSGIGANTDVDGEFIITDIPPGIYIVSIRYIGYDEHTEEIEILEGRETKRDIFVNPSSIEVDVIEVKEERRVEKVTEAPASIEVISAKDIKRETTTNLGSYLKGIKGVDFTSSGVNNYSISVRGFNSSFSTRLLTLTDGRVASIPALRVINYSSIPQSMEDVEKIEVVLGPATALYGANAHSGVVNITSKAPSKSEGFTMNASGTNDDRELRKINARIAKKLTKSISFKLSGTYLTAQEWPFISELEYKQHRLPWSPILGRKIDGKDNNPWNAATYPFQGGEQAVLSYLVATNNSGEDVIIGDGEPNHGDLDGDGVAGEDWYNGFDDDGDGLIDEDYFYADGIDNEEPYTDWNGDGEYTSEPFDDWNGDGEYSGEQYVDSNNNTIYDLGESFTDSNGNGVWDSVYEPFEDLDGDGEYSEVYEPFEDWNSNGVWDGQNDQIDENIDHADDAQYDGYDNDGNGYADDSLEKYNKAAEAQHWGYNIENNDIIISGGRKFETVNGSPNPWYIDGNCDDLGNCTNPNVMGTHRYNEDERVLEFDTFIYDTDGDGIFDSGDGCYACDGESFIDNDGDNRWDEGEAYTDSNGDGQYTPADYMDNFQRVDDINGDGLDDYPDFGIENRKVELRIDYDPSDNFNASYQSGYAWTKTQQVTGTGRYLADGFEYTFHQLRSRYKNLFAQVYLNRSYSGNTRSYNLGNVITDKSMNMAAQAQHTIDLDRLNTKLIWGFDYFRTMPQTNGSIINDGPNGYDNDGDNVVLSNNGIDDDGDGYIDEDFCDDGTTSKVGWLCGEGVDEEDEFLDVISNEFGGYIQTKTTSNNKKLDLILAARADYNDILAEGIQFAPKAGILYHPFENSTIRATYGKAYNTPNALTLYTDLYIGRTGLIDIYLRGNKDGTPYQRVTDEYNISTPVYYDNDGNLQDLALAQISSDYYNGYAERVMGAPYFFNLQDAGFPNDMIPLDTSRYLIYVPELNDDGMVYSAENSINISNVDPIKTEKIQTFELGLKGMLTKRTIVNIDYYISFYEDFFSPPTAITPFVVLRYNGDGTQVTATDDLNIVGMIPVNSIGSNPPYGTAWNGIDDDGDWGTWASELGWIDDKNGDCLDPLADINYDPLCLQDPGEWAYIEWFTELNSSGDGIDTVGYQIHEPGDPEFSNPINDPDLNQGWQSVGVDEYSLQTGLNEAELIVSGLIGGDGELITGPGLAYSPPHLVLSSLNYGDVTMQGIDMSFTHFIPEWKLIFDGNIAYYGTTDFINELTGKKDPINAPKWKWNLSVKWDTDRFGNFAVSYRHVDRFEWKDGIWSGVIGPYNLIDIHYNYKINKYLGVSLSGLNIFNDVHKEMIGGAKMGRQIMLRLTSSI